MNIAQIATRRYTTKAFDPSRKLSPATIDAVCTLLRNSPSSVNSQPWHFFIAASDEAKSRIAKATHGGFAYNEPKVRNASHLVVLCGLERFSDAHLSAVLAQEQSLTRSVNLEDRNADSLSRRNLSQSTLALLPSGQKGNHRSLTENLGQTPLHQRANGLSAERVRVDVEVLVLRVDPDLVIMLGRTDHLEPVAAQPLGRPDSRGLRRTPHWQPRTTPPAPSASPRPAGAGRSVRR